MFRKCEWASGLVQEYKYIWKIITMSSFHESPWRFFPFDHLPRSLTESGRNISGLRPIFLLPFASSHLASATQILLLYIIFIIYSSTQSSFSFFFLHILLLWNLIFVEFLLFPPALHLCSFLSSFILQYYILPSSYYSLPKICLL